MKNNIKLIILASVGMLFSCQKDNIEVVKNLDKSWEVDSKIKDADIRNRLGYDPRFNYALIETTELNFPMLSLGGLPISGENRQEIEVKILKPLEKDLNVTLQYDSELFESIKKDYLGYDLGTEDLIPFTEKTKVISKGETSVKFVVSVVNNPTFKGKLVVPFSLKTSDDSVKLLDTKERLIFKVYNEEVSFTYPTRVAKNLILGNYMYSTDIQIPLSISRVLADQLTLSLQRSDLNVPNMAPENVEGTLPKDVDFSLKDEIKFNWKLETANYLTERQNYQIPLQVVAKIGDKSYTLPDNILVVLNTDFSEDDNLYLGQKPIGSPISKAGMRLTTLKPIWSPLSFIDNNYRSNNYGVISSENQIKIDLGGTKNIQSINVARRFKKLDYRRYFTSIDVYVINEFDQEVKLATMKTSDNGDVTINLNVAIKAKALIFKNIKDDSSISYYYYGITEIDIYE
ncbi:hypothetical protein ACILD6_04535 [Capnocytophaga canimorsus]|uniref:hypothetical protein n=1 Tax=Capnocytophaga canimorsus TaxID=28188 RepID=UPI0037CE559F